MKKIFSYLLGLLRESWNASLPLIKITIPVVCVVRIFDVIGLSHYINGVLAPLMKLTGLPVGAGIVWASALVGNLYSAFIVFINCSAELHLTIAQVTILLSMVLIAHSLPMELKATQLVGISPIYMGILRILGAVVLGWVLLHLYQATDSYQQLATPLLIKAQQGSKTWLQWGIGESKNLGLIYCIVLGLMVLTRLMRWLRLDIVLQWLFWPLNTLLKTDLKTTNFNIIGMIAGISYGSALMLKELKMHSFSRRDILVTVTFMGLAHGLIEETLLMVTLGADWTGVLLGRVLLGFTAALAVSMLIKRDSAILGNRFVMDDERLDMAGIGHHRAVVAQSHNLHS